MHRKRNHKHHTSLYALNRLNKLSVCNYTNLGYFAVLPGVLTGRIHLLETPDRGGFFLWKGVNIAAVSSILKYCRIFTICLIVGQI